MSTATHESAAKVEPHVYGPPVTVEVMVKVQALAFLEAHGRYSVVVPELPGCITQGDTIEEVREMVKDAAEGWLAAGHDLQRDPVIFYVTEPLPSEIMKPVSGERMRRAVERKGWQFLRTASSHHIYQFYQHADSMERISIPVHGNEDLATGTQHRIMQQAGLTEADL